MLRFHPGQIVASAKMREALSEDQIFDLVRRHARGELRPEPQPSAYEQALRDGSPITSTIRIDGPNGEQLTVWIVTEPDRGRTFVVFPHESPFRASDLEEVPGPLKIDGI